MLTSHLVLILTGLTMTYGYLDDRYPAFWNEYRKGAADFVVSACGAFLLLCGGENLVWLPFTKTVFHFHPAWYFVFSTSLLWISINTTNCSDGVDGLSGTMVVSGLFITGLFLYVIVGHSNIAGYLLIPHDPESSKWSIMVFTFMGGLCGYLWYNAHPSLVLMGDAGSRALGFILGLSVLKTGNPLILFMTSSVLLVNGGAGLAKVALLRMFGLRIFRTTRFPLHDHFRLTRQWSSTQVLVRFNLIQMLIAMALFGIFIKVR